jgi:hypothetical protein
MTCESPWSVRFDQANSTGMRPIYKDVAFGSPLALESRSTRGNQAAATHRLSMSTSGQVPKPTQVLSGRAMMSA